MSIKVGNKVRYLNHYYVADKEYFSKGQIYIVTDIYEIDKDNTNMTSFFLDNEKVIYVYLDQVEIIKVVKDTKLARKMYSNYEKDGDYLIILEG